MTYAEHVAEVADFYKQLIEAGIPADIAAVMAVDYNASALRDGGIKPDPRDHVGQMKVELKREAQLKREQRERELQQIGEK